jgi:uncharacterized protein (TIGR03067 family)
MRSLLLPLALFCLAFAPAPFPKADANKAEQKKLQGTWAVVRRTLNGTDYTSRTIDTVEIVGDRIRFLVQGDARTEWVFTLDVTKKPRVLDRKKVWGKGAAPLKSGKTEPLLYHGIYRLEGDTLLFVHTSARTSKQRPTEFDGKKPGETLYTLKRVKR